MGCAPRASTCKGGSIRLISTKLTFTKDQLLGLNTYFRKIVEESRSEDDAVNITAIESTVERLVQRLIAGVGDLDQRFSSMFLISLNEPRRIKVLRFEYILRLDALSTPIVNPELEAIVTVEEDAAMPGFVRLKVLSEYWQKYTDISGRLRRDLVKGKLANLLATTIKREVSSQGDGKNCTSPGQVVDAEVLDKILKQSNYCKVFYGSAIGDGPLPEPRQHRVALIEDVSGIILRIELEGYKTREIEVRLLIGIGLSSWSNLADFPRRVTLHHCDALLYYSAAQTGMYAVAVGPYSGARCENRATLWRVRVPAAEKIMNEHYADDSIPALTESALMEILYQLRKGCPPNLSIKHKEGRKKYSVYCTDELHVVSRHILRTIHRWSLERAGPDPLTCWAPDSLSRHILLALDDLVTALRCQNLRCYIHPRCNVMLQCTRGGVLHHEDSYAADARVLQFYLAALHHHSFTVTPANPSPFDLMEGELIAKWRSVIASLPRGTMTTDHGYSRRQLEYLNLILQEVLRARNSLLQDHVDECSYLSSPEFSYNITEQLENLLYLLRLALNQARDQIYFANANHMRLRGHRNILKKRKHYNTTSKFDHSVELLIDIVRRDRETANVDMDTCPLMAKMFLQWLYIGMEHDKKILEPILRPYLNNLFNSLHEYCHYVNSWRKRQESYISEMSSLTTFCKLVLTQKVSPAIAIVDFLSNGWSWAESLVKMIERGGNSLRLIFHANGRVIRYNLIFPENKALSTFSTWSKARTVARLIRRRRLGYNEYRLQREHSETSIGSVAGHIELRNMSPLTYVVSMNRARLRQRGPGDLISAMISLSKFRILQEVAAILPREERVAMLDMIQHAARESSRTAGKFPCQYLSPSDSPKQIYRPRAESSPLDSRTILPAHVHQSSIISEHQKQLQLELRGMQDTLRSNAFPRVRASLWDSRSVSSWTSSADTSLSTMTFRKYRLPIWDTIKGCSPVRNYSSTDNNREESKFGEMISREESPNWNTMDRHRRRDNSDSKDEDRLPSWETLESALNQQLCSYRITAGPESDRVIEKTDLATISDTK